MGVFDRLKNAVASRARTVKNYVKSFAPVFSSAEDERKRLGLTSQQASRAGITSPAAAGRVGFREANPVRRFISDPKYRQQKIDTGQEIAKTIVRAPFRAVGYAKATLKNQTLEPKGKVGRVIFGSEPIKPYKEAVKGGVETGVQLAGRVGIQDSPILRKVLGPFAAAGAIILPASDLFGAGALKKGLTKGALESLAKTTVKEDVAKVLSKQGIKASDDVLEAVAKSSDSEEIKRILSQVKEAGGKKIVNEANPFAGKTTTKIAGELPVELSRLAKSATKYPTPEEFRKAVITNINEALRSDNPARSTQAQKVLAALKDEKLTFEDLYAMKGGTKLEGKGATELTKSIDQQVDEQVPKMPETPVKKVPVDPDSAEPPLVQAPERPVPKDQKSQVLEDATLAEKGTDVTKQIDEVPKTRKEKKAADEAVRVEVAKVVEDKKKNLEKVLYGETPELKTGTKGAGFIGTKTRAAQEAASGAVAKGLQSENPLVRNLAGGIRAFFGQSGNVGEQAAKLRRVRGAEASSVQIANDLDKLVRETVDNSEESLGRIHAVLDPDISKLTVKEADLTAKEIKALTTLRQTSDFINDQNFANGFISKEVWEKGKDGKYIARAYDEYDLPPELKDTEAFKSAKGKLDLGAFKKRKDIDEWKLDHAINDPSYLTAKRLQQTVRNNEIKKYADWVAGREDMVSKVARAGYTELSDSPMWGALAGKFVRHDVLEGIKGFYSDNKAMQGLMDLLNWYDRLAPRRFLKKSKTVYNPAVRLGNQFGNRTFALLNGINPFAFEKNIQTYAKKALKENDQLVRALRENGVVGSDYARKELVDTLAEVGKRSKKKNPFQKGDQFVTETYSNADDVAKIAAAKYWIDKGKSFEETIEKVSRGFQDYNSVGKLYDMGAKIPVFGNAFVRFQGDLIRILKNAALENPLALAGTAGAIYFAGKMFSKLSGESEEDYQTRTTRVGTPVIPYTKIPLAFQTPWGEINAARLFGIYSLTPAGGESGVGNQISRQLPFQIPTNKRELGAGLTSDPLIGPLVGTAANIDFRGKSVRDPEENQYQPSTLTTGEKNVNRAEYLGRSYNLPFFNDVLNLYRSTKGQKSIYDKEMSPGQAAARLAGVKVEQFGPKQAKEVRERNQMFADKDNEAIQKQINQVVKDELSGKINQETANKRIESLNKKLGKTKPAGSNTIRETDEGFKYIYNGKLLTADTRSEAEQGVAKEAFRSSGEKFQIAGNKVYSRNKDGSVRSIDLADYLGAEYDYRLAVAKADKDYKSYAKAAGGYVNDLSKILESTKDADERVNVLGKQENLLQDMYKFFKTKGSVDAYVSKAKQLMLALARRKLDPDLLESDYYEIALQEEKLKDQIATALESKEKYGKGKRVKTPKISKESPSLAALNDIKDKTAANPFKVKPKKVALASTPSKGFNNPFRR